jgi:predicted nucleic acid-binding protein
LKVLIDSSFLFSALVFDGKPLKTLMMIAEENTLVLSDYVIEEVKRNIKNKLAPVHYKAMLGEFQILVDGCEVKSSIEYGHLIKEAIKLISGKDSPILACGMLPDVDYLLTSDKEFWKIKNEKVQVINPEDIHIIIKREKSL